jgi:hypothetical protein
MLSAGSAGTLIKVEAALLVPSCSNRGWIGIKTLMPKISLDGVAVLYIQPHVIPRPKAVGDLSRNTEMSLERYVVI